MTQITSEMMPMDGGTAFLETVTNWLSRPVPERGQNLCFDLPAILATDIGLKRNENQDRVAALRLSVRHSSKPIIAIALADGMGGMRDGGACATLAISSFFYALVRNRHQRLEQQAAAAVSYANQSVFSFAGGRGGATLSALLFHEEEQPVIVNLGDSRVYACGKGITVERLTVDDSLEEAVGGHGRALIQFVGMGVGMQPHIRMVPLNVTELALTTDGIHFIDPDTFASVLFQAPDAKAASERLSALARWCGGHDNASIALVDLPALVLQAAKTRDGGIQMWDPFGTMAINWLRDIRETPRLQGFEAPKSARIKATPDQRSSGRKDSTGTRRTSKKTGGNRKAPKDDVQLEIQIEKSAETQVDDDNSR